MWHLMKEEYLHFKKRIFFMTYSWLLAEYLDETYNYL